MTTILGATHDMIWRGEGAPILVIKAPQAFFAADDVHVLGQGTDLRFTCSLDNIGRVVTPPISLRPTEGSLDKPDAAQYVAHLEGVFNGGAVSVPFGVFGAGFGVPDSGASQTWADIIAFTAGTLPGQVLHPVNVSGLLTAALLRVLGSAQFDGPITSNDTLQIVGDANVSNTLIAANLIANLSGSTGFPGTPGGTLFSALETAASGWARWGTDGNPSRVFDFIQNETLRGRFHGNGLDVYGLVGIGSYARSGLPAPFRRGRFAVLTDDNRGLVRDTGDQWVSDGLRLFNIADFGARANDGVTDYSAANAAAIQAAIISAKVSGNVYGTGALYVPDGRFDFNATLSFDDMQGVDVMGASSIGSALVYTGAGAQAITMRSAQSMEIKGLSFAYSNAGFTGEFFRLGHSTETGGTGGDSAFIYFDNIVCRNLSAAIASCWINMDRAINCGVLHSRFLGAKYAILTCDPGHYSYVHDVRGCYFNYQEIAPIALDGSLESWTIEGNTFEPLHAFGARPAPNVAVMTIGGTQQLNMSFIRNWIGDGNWTNLDNTLNADAVAVPQVHFGNAYGLEITGNRIGSSPVGNVIFKVDRFEGLYFAGNRTEGGGVSLGIGSGSFSYGLTLGGNSLASAITFSGLVNVLDIHINGNSGATDEAKMFLSASERRQNFARQETIFASEIARFYGTNSLGGAIEAGINPYVTIGSGITALTGGYVQWDNTAKRIVVGVHEKPGVAIDTNGNIEILQIGAGMIVPSPDGTRYRATMANGGTWAIAPA